MKTIKNYIGEIGVVVAILAVVAIFYSIFSITSGTGFLGNKSVLSIHSRCKTASATSSVAVLANSGAATSTIICDAYALDASNGDGSAIDSAALLVQFTAASTTNSTLKVQLQYSNDGSDWYNNYLTSSEATSSFTITPTTLVVTNFIYSLVTPTRYVRVLFNNTGLATSSVWAEIVPKKQVN